MISDYNCSLEEVIVINEEVKKRLNLRFPEAYLNADSMMRIALFRKDQKKAAYCELPFCHTVEAEALGGEVEYGNEKVGPRAKSYVYSSIEELMALKQIDFSEGRICEVLLACQMLKDQGEMVVLEVSGPFTILNVLIDPVQIFKAMRRKPDDIKTLFSKFEAIIMNYIEKAVEHGVDVISYADSAGGVNILGPKMMKQTVDEFTYRFLKKVENILGDKTIVHLCPKTTLALIGTGKAEFVDYSISGKLRYDQAILEVIGKVKLVGQGCVKEVDRMMTNGVIQEVRLV